MTEGITRGFIEENILKLTDEKHADSILYGTIKKVTDKPVTYTETQEGEFVQEYRITIYLDVEWYDVKNNKTILKRRFSGFSEYDPTGSTEVTREVAIQKALSDITEDIINSITTSGW